MVDDRSPSAKALAVVSQITTISLSGAIPVVVGYGLDSWLGTRPALLLAGVGFGGLAAIFQLTRLVKQLEADAEDDSQR